MAPAFTPFFLMPPTSSSVAGIAASRPHFLTSIVKHRMQRMHVKHPRHVHRPPTSPVAVAIPPPQPDDAAVDMLTFALSGPGYAAVAICLAAAATVLLPYFDIGPRRTPPGVPDEPQQRRNRGKTAIPTVFYLQVTLPTSHITEFPDGRTRLLKEGDSILRFRSREECEAVARPLRMHATSYFIYRLVGLSMQKLSIWPRRVNRAPSSTPTFPGDNDASSEPVDPSAVWAQYEMLGATDEVEANWSKFMSKQPSISFTNINASDGGADAPFADDGTRNVAPCKLCGGKGTTRCYRCGGASLHARIPSTCDCNKGRRPCEWCAQT